MPWCADLPIISVPQSDQPKLVTIVLPYYESPKFLRWQRQWWATFPASLRAWLRVIVCDDASPLEPAEPLLNPPIHERLFRNEGPDLPWNWLSARNRGAHEAEDGWLLMTDMDHVVPQSTAEALVYGKHDPARVYAFSRLEHSGEKLNPHSASFFLTKAMFWTIGGYDERFSGVYGTDGMYRQRVRKTAPMAILTDRLIRYEYQQDSSTSAYQRKLKSDDVKREAIKASLPKGSSPLVLSFPYVEIQP